MYEMRQGVPGEVVPSGESGLRRRGSTLTSGEVEASQLRRLNIKKDDEFFHFILLCFAIGALLVCYHYYTDWFMSLGVGLLTFASLETVGIYFGLVYRIHSVLHGFIPFFQKFRLIGFILNRNHEWVLPTIRRNSRAGVSVLPFRRDAVGEIVHSGYLSSPDPVAEELEWKRMWSCGEAGENSEKQIKLVTYDEKYLKDQMENG
ncbi:hypothetical protein JEQ12_008579 [Ovis aries]|uniref:Transmembrane protein 40 n=1 Tax=Ovis aries TaxID=9940 RepID=A0A835ZNW9_SHEEP|nr:hypothetical protein JEQ12_008579 [Ovis aries]